MYTKMLLFVVALPQLVSSRPTHCERWKGGSEFRCGKDNYKADKVHIRNIGDKNITFQVGKWMSKCGEPGINYSEQSYSLGGGGSADVDFIDIPSGRCNELFVYRCKMEGSHVDCLDVVSVYPV